MGGGCLLYPRTCRPAWPVLIVLATVPFVLRGSESPAAVVGKMYPRGNHWAVGHLMGKKSAESVPETNPASGSFTPPETAGVTGLDRYEHLMQKSPKQVKPQPAAKLRSLGSSWREENRDKYLREMSKLLLLAEKLVRSDST